MDLRIFFNFTKNIFVIIIGPSVTLSFVFRVFLVVQFFVNAQLLSKAKLSTHNIATSHTPSNYSSDNIDLNFLPWQIPRKFYNSNHFSIRSITKYEGTKFNKQYNLEIYSLSPKNMG